MIFDLAQDFHDAVAAMPRKHPKHRMLELLEEAIRRDIHFITAHPTTLFQCLWNTCWWYDCSEAAKHYEEPEGGSCRMPPWNEPAPKLSTILEHWRSVRKQGVGHVPWLRSLRPPVHPLGRGPRVVLPQGNKHLALSPDRRLIASSDNCVVNLWDARSGKLLRSLRGHRSPVERAVFSRDGSKLVSASAPALKVFDRASSLVEWEEGAVRAWDATSGALLSTFSGHSGEVKCLAISHDGSQVVSASAPSRISDDGRPIIWDIGDRNISISREIAVSFRQDGDLLRVFEAETGRPLANLKGPKPELVKKVTCSAPGGTGTLIAPTDCAICVWALETGEEVARLEGQHALAASLAFSADGSRVLASVQGEVQGWETRSGRCLASVSEEDKRALAAAILPDAPPRRPAGREPESATDVSMHQRCGGLASRCCSIVYAPNGEQLLVISTNEVWILDARSGAVITILPGSPDFQTAAYSADSRRVVTGGGTWDKRICIWDANTGGLLQRIAGHRWGAVVVKYSPREQQIVSGSADNTVRVWKEEDGKEMCRFVGHDRDITCIDCSADGGRVVSGSADKTLRVWDVSTGRMLHCLAGHVDYVRCVSFSPDDRYVASGSWSKDGTVRVWDVGMPHSFLMAKFGRLGSSVTDIAFSETGNSVVALFDDGTIEVLDATSGRSSNTMEGFADVHAIAAGPSKFPWWVSGHSRETYFRSARHGYVVGWFPAGFKLVRTHPCGLSWAGLDDGCLYMVALDGVAP